MGKVFVKGPVESPDDLLAKESQAARMGRVIADAGEGALNFTKPVDNFADFAGKPLNFLRYLAEGRYKRKPSPLEEAMERARLKQTANETLAQQNAANEKASDIAIMEARDPANTEAQYMDPLPKLTGRGRLPFSAQRKDLRDAMRQRELDYEKIRGWGDAPSQVAARKEREAQLTQQARDNLFRQAEQDRLLGEETDEETTAKKTAKETQQAGDASDPMADMTAQGLKLRQEGIDNAPAQPDLMHPDVQNKIKEASDELLGDSSVKPNVAEIASHPETTSLPEGGESAENNNDAAMEAKVNEQGLNDNSESTQEALQQQGGEKEEPDLDEATTGGAMQVPATTFNFDAGAPKLPMDVPAAVFSGNDALAQMQRDQGRD